jgi:ATP-dependent Clp protease protease subunit
MEVPGGPKSPSGRPAEPYGPNPPGWPPPAGRPERPVSAPPPPLWEGPGFLEAQLLDRRLVRIWGPLDDYAVSRACAEMMALDATGDSAVQLYIGSSGGPLHAALTLIDTMDLLGVPVHVTCLGRVEGAAVGVVAAGVRRVAAPHAQFYLTEPEVTASGNASQLTAWAEHHRVQLNRFVGRLAEATRRPAEHLEADLSLGRWLDADQALGYGLVDEVWSPPGRRTAGEGPPSEDRPRPEGPDHPFGFRPSH